MTATNPFRTANSMMTAMTGSVAGKNIALLNVGSFGGYSNLLNNTYIFSGSTNNWTNLSSAPIDPNGPLPCRTNGVFSWDGNNGFLMGGNGSSSSTGILSDVWILGKTSNTWTQVGGVGFSLTVPYGRFNAEGAFLNGASPGVLIFSGQVMNSLIEETWLWTSTSTSGTFAQISVANGVGPAARTGHCLVGNTPAGSTPGTVVLFSGQGTNSQYNDTWTYTASAGWTLANLTGASPSIRSNACMCYDTAGSRWILFSGENAYGYLTDTWTLNAGVTAWTQLSVPAGTGPAGRIGASFAYDATSGYATMYGGQTSTAGYTCSETWQLQSNTWVQL